MNAQRMPVMALLMAAFVLAGCNLPISQTPTPVLFPTPNLTMTALFERPVIIQPSATVAPPPTATLPPAINPTATLPPPPVNTLVPTPTSPLPTSTKTSVPTNMRPGVSTVAEYIATPLAIDGDWSDWKTTAYPATFVVFGKSNWANSEDFEGSYRVGWDNTNLYVAFKAIDDRFVQNATGEDIFKGDSVELLLDTNVTGDFFDDSLSGDDFQIGITPGKVDVGLNMEAYLWYPTSKAGRLTNIKFGAIKQAGIWRVEAAIPWSVFGITPADGLHFGFALSASDNDKAGQNVQETMVSSTPNRILADPTTWGDLTLKK